MSKQVNLKGVKRAYIVEDMTKAEIGEAFGKKALYIINTYNLESIKLSIYAQAFLGETHDGSLVTVEQFDSITDSLKSKGFTKDELMVALTDETLTLKDLADSYDMDINIIINCINLLDNPYKNILYKTRSTRSKLRIYTEEQLKHYIDMGLNISGIADELGVTPQSVGNILKRYELRNYYWLAQNTKTLNDLQKIITLKEINCEPEFISKKLGLETDYVNKLYSRRKHIIKQLQENSNKILI